jgi:hypothetical protein
MTVRRRVLSRKASAHERLCVSVELWSASMLAGFWWLPPMSTRRWWQDFAAVNGARVEAKVREACPGTRPGWWYACGRLPPVPLLEGEPDRMSGWYRQHVVIDGVKHWRLGEGWQVRQADHLQALGELDGEELRRHRAWRRRGFPIEYRLDKFPDRPVGWFVHGCY